MKRTFAKQSFMRFLMGFFLFSVLAFSANKASAQSWLPPAQALVKLDTEIQAQKSLVVSNNPGSPAYENALIHVIFYLNIATEINDGLPVGPAVDSGLEKVANGTTAFSTPIGKAQRQVLFADAEALLKQ